MANKKIRLTYLWADETVMRNDFSKKVSQTMTDWANKFYATYGFELDVEPSDALRTTVPKASKYALAKNKGVRPDFDLIQRIGKDEKKEEALEREIKAMEKVVQDVLQTVQRIEAIERAEKARIRTLEQELAQTPRSDVDNVIRLNQAIGQANKDLTVTLTHLTDAFALLKQARDKRDALIQQALGLVRQISRRLVEGDFQRILRRQMTGTFLAHNIGSETRLNVVFCEFVPPIKSGDRPTSGATLPAIGPIIWFPTNEWLWPYVYVIVDLKAQRRTIAHEVIHAANGGVRTHPSPAAVAKIVEKWFQKPFRPGGSIFDTPVSAQMDYMTYMRHYGESVGGYFDGAPNDIMNYSQHDKEPGDYILSDPDKELLGRAKFVSP